MARSDYPGAKAFLPEDLSRTSLTEAVQACRGCDLFENATQAVFGAGEEGARLMLVGEQPGDAEDRAGEPFVGPAGRLLDQALEAAGIDRTQVYVTNAVKHFRFRGGAGKRRIHQGPAQWHIAACHPWVLAELDLVQPRGVVLLGSTAGKAFFGGGFRVGEQRGQRVMLPARPDIWSIGTIHPSAALRAENRDELFAGLVDDLQTAARLLDR
jgi:uracil-DNA glycosylase family protein